jgi:hypothetical protein
MPDEFQKYLQVQHFFLSQKKFKCSLNHLGIKEKKKTWREYGALQVACVFARATTKRKKEK